MAKPVPTLLVIGASGYIGSGVVHRAVELGQSVIATSRDETKIFENGVLVETAAGLDVLDPACRSRDFGADCIVHCATANDQVSKSFESGVNLSVNGTRNVLELAAHNAIRNIVFLSTFQVYGTELEGAVSESRPTCCESGYALNHLMGEELCRLYCRTNAMNVALLRPSNVFGVPVGDRVNRSTLVPMCFIQPAVSSAKIVLRSSGLQSRNFISVLEVANQIIALVGDFPAGCSVINCASNWYATIFEIAEMTAAAYRELKNQELHVERQYEDPKKSNAFHVSSIRQDSWPTAENMKQQMVVAIRELLIRAMNTVRNADGSYSAV